MKKIMAIVGVLFFLVAVLFVVPFQGYALNPQPEPPAKIKTGVAVNESYIGTIVKIEGNNVTVRDEKGVEKIVTGKFTGLKVGGKVKVTTKNGLTWLNPQPEPPLPSKAKPLAQ